MTGMFKLIRQRFNVWACRNKGLYTRVLGMSCKCFKTRLLSRLEKETHLWSTWNSVVGKQYGRHFLLSSFHATVLWFKPTGRIKSIYTTLIIRRHTKMFLEAIWPYTIDTLVRQKDTESSWYYNPIKKRLFVEQETPHLLRQWKRDAHALETLSRRLTMVYSFSTTNQLCLLVFCIATDVLCLYISRG